MTHTRSIYGKGMKERILGVMEESIAYIKGYEMNHDFVVLFMEKEPIACSLKVPTSVIHDNEIKLDKLCGKKVSILRTPQRYLFKILKEAE